MSVSVMRDFLLKFPEICLCNEINSLIPPRKIVSLQSIWILVGRRFARQHFADSREPIRKKEPIFEALGQVRANRGLSPIRIQIRVIRVQFSLLSIFWKVNSQNKGSFRSENRFAENRPTKIWMLQYCASLASNLRQVWTTPPLRRPPWDMNKHRGGLEKPASNNNDSNCWGAQMVLGRVVRALAKGVGRKVFL